MEKIVYKTELCFGTDALQQLEQYKNESFLVVIDPFLKGTEQLENILHRIDSSNQVHVFSEIIPDPPIEVVVKGIQEGAGKHITIVMAIGGGSAIDASKAIYYFGKQQQVFQNATLIVIPTTSGTGSEVTDFSIITDSEKGTKYPLISRDILPDVAILDPAIVATLPKNITADTGMDVLTHAIEAYVSVKATDFSDALAEKAIKLVFEYLPKAYANGNDMEAREKMHNASTLAGMAFNTASLGLNHGIAHAAGAKFHVPHGRLNSIIMPHLIRYNANMSKTGKIGFDKRAAQRYRQIANLIGCSASNDAMGVRQLITAIQKLQKALDMPASLKEYGVESQTFVDYLEEVAKAAIKDRCTDTNPRVPKVEEVVELLKAMY
ncbi:MULTISPECIES: 1-propanol dehydrogenase PduQ [unclassified Granulicatella]|uniref:1-propanol dehydrogenase PduQ n=1 Tax=unclassified Granulicatella TaxID=2630493 RepID=UPI001073F139|nr:MULTISPECIES: 1-propanol dehydrogenase PduQ [unclassified Granulicatella]MBF0780113.1 iron-containing alcohol dehydrogenase [Granulicatella sp. 19428wC4_WM01]TFU95779.1 iron-containing alcohol dehydrogenase [Granulicatella sp. WM01]